jgi:exosortase D (VPLPA-CTERM-specific)
LTAIRPLQRSGRAELAFRVRDTGPLWFGLAAISGIAVFWYGFESLLAAWQTPQYSHGPVIPMLSSYMFLREMKAVPPTDRPVTDRWPGVALVAFALTVGIAGNLARIPDIVTYALILWIGGMVLVCFGLKRGWYFWPSVLHLVFMLPLPQFVFWKVTIFLQLMSSQIGVSVISALGIPVFLDGNVIDLGVYKLQVAEACSGLRYLFPVMSFSYVFGVLYTGPVWHKLALFSAAAPMTVLMNAFRIGVIGVLVDRFGIAQAEGFLHVFEGWIIFVACITILFGLAWVMHRLQGNRMPLGQSIDLDFSGIGAQVARVRAVAPSRAIAVAALMTLTVAVGWHLVPQREAVTVSREPLALFPDQIGNWHGRAGSIEPAIEKVLGADDYHTASFRSPGEAQPVNLFIAWYAKTTEGEGIHSPQVCLPAGGWEVSEWAPTNVVTASGEEVPLVRAMIRKGMVRELVYYWFALRGRRVTNDFVAKAYTVWDSATRGRSDGAIIRFVTPVGEGESTAAAEARAIRFMSEALPLLPRFVPG